MITFRRLSVVVAATVTSVVPALAVPSALAATVTTVATAGSATHLVAGARPGLAPMALHHGSKIANQQSENWSGYIKPTSGATSAAGTWTVPSLSTQYNGYSSTWVGIDGASANDQYLIQTGTEADMSNGRATYDAWWEVITPTNVAPEVLFSGFTVSPGQSITATVTKTSSTKWTMSLKNNTTGQTASHSATFAGPGSSAEWIQEDTDVNNSISPAPDWHSVTFAGATVNGANAALTSSEAVDIVDSQGTQEDSTSAPNSTANGFTVTWLAPGTATPLG